MSVSLCVIRLSINDNSPVPKAVSYARLWSNRMAESSPPPTPGVKPHDALHDKPSIAWEKVDEDGRSHPILAKSKAESVEEAIEKCKGLREEKEIRIETYNVEERFVDECTEDHQEPKQSYAGALAGRKVKDRSHSSGQPSPLGQPNLPTHLPNTPRDEASQDEQVPAQKERTQNKADASSDTANPHEREDEKDMAKPSVETNEDKAMCSDAVSETICDNHGDESVNNHDLKGAKSPSQNHKEEQSDVKHEISIKEPTKHQRSVAATDHRRISAASPTTVLSEASEGGRSSKSPVTSLRRRIPFFSGNPVVDITKGTVHLFKENQMTSLDDGVLRSDMICALAVPATLICHDLLQFFSPLAEGIEHVRIIRDSNPNQYMTLIKFRSQNHADEFYKEYNGKPYNSFDEFVCYLVFVSRVECMKACEGASLATPGLTELPTCNICLERMEDSVEGILTILCNHTFHGSCLTKWGDTSCPVCRYNQTPEPSVDNKCFQCGAQESLWICLICGHIGCGRYVEAHAYHHFEDTQHTYAMQLGKQRVWDYAGDNYVHRLVQSKGDGKPVSWERTGGDGECEEKFDALTLEYTYLLNSQLESQRLYYEEKMTRIEADALAQVSEIEVRSRKLMEERDRMERDAQKAQRERQLTDKKNVFLAEKLGKVLSQLSEETEMNKCLRENQSAWQNKVTDLDKRLEAESKQKSAEILELKEQIRDLMFFLEAQETLNKTPESTRQEIQDGQITIGASPALDSRPTRKGRKKGK